MDAKIGKLLVLAAALRCLAPALSIAAAASHKSPFQPPFDQQDAASRARRAMCAAGKPYRYYSGFKTLLKITLQTGVRPVGRSVRCGQALSRNFQWLRLGTV